MALIRIGATHERRAFPLALIAIATVAAVAACGSSRSKPAAQAPQAAATPQTRTQATQTFTSRRYGFRVTLNKGWSETDAQVRWSGRHLEGLASPAFARFIDSASARTLAAAAAPVTGGMELAKWRAAMVRAAPDVCSDSSSVKQTTLGGESALAWTATCTDGYHVNKIAALHGRRGYIILLGSQTGSNQAVGRGIFDSMRGSFRFTH